MKKAKVKAPAKSKSEQFTAEFRKLIEKYDLHGVGLVFDNIDGVDNAIYTGIGLTASGTGENRELVEGVLNVSRLYQYMREGVLKHNWFS